MIPSQNLLKEFWQSFLKPTEISVNRRSTSVVFTSDDENVLVADKSGDVFKYSVTEPSSEGQLLMGHLSMLLDMKLTADDRYLVSCDRDEKIRVSHFPNAYNIHSYCLGHTDFVTHLAYVPGAEAIISASGDGTIRCWNLKGEALHCLSHGIQAKTEAEEPPLQQTKPSDCLAIIRCFAFNPHSGALAVTFDSSSVLQVYKVTREEKTLCISLQDDHNLPCVPWDVQFGPDSSLWVLLPLQEKPVAIFNYLPEDGDADTFKIKELEVSSLSKEVLQIQKTLSEDWDFFKESLDVPCWTKALAKSRVDNTLDYLKRKEQQMKKKQKPSQSEGKLSEDSAKEPSAKVAKME
ncbi:tRNA (guanine-N(7)-)-methyltransferase non-catalytic subunit wdr4 isoform X3 [Octopus bimaculoides]|uniref:tRNA (guanine-N(7)-)-methyltransferase non-catalytic subunit wdr4 isoform X3 n=1 Tax=Octopus bimaculoides TaxID=37653 RepID=UPI0022E97801|nr:tRNA (guanine-N(7)-)-methyltransferase non-catalytic subunit wdr4 isoform X3 [Octopus bimaculoides]